MYYPNKPKDLFKIGNKQSKKRKTQIKASAQPKVVKNDKAVSDSVIEESKPNDKGLDLDDIKTVIDNDVEKAIAIDYSTEFDMFDSTEEFTITTEGKQREKRISKPKVNALPESVILEVLHTIWETNRDSLIKLGNSKKEASKLAGCTYKEFMPYLNVVIPDNYEPRNRKSKAMKSKGSADWKLYGVNKEAVNRRMKQLMAKGSLIIFIVNGKYHLVPTQSMVKNVEAYKGSIWHINQIRNILYQTEQWNQGSNPYINLFKPTNPLGLEIKNFEKVLGLDSKMLQAHWTKSGFDEENLLKEIGAI